MMKESYVEQLPGVQISGPELSEWECYLFGGGENGIVWQPLKGKEPNWFWRWMQYVFFGNRWVKGKE